jgi:hypothetical protein
VADRVSIIDALKRSYPQSPDTIRLLQDEYVRESAILHARPARPPTDRDAVLCMISRHLNPLNGSAAFQDALIHNSKHLHLRTCHVPIYGDLAVGGARTVERLLDMLEAAKPGTVPAIMDDIMRPSVLPATARRLAHARGERRVRLEEVLCFEPDSDTEELQRTYAGRAIPALLKSVHSRHQGPAFGQAARRLAVLANCASDLGYTTKTVAIMSRLEHSKDPDLRIAAFRFFESGYKRRAPALEAIDISAKFLTLTGSLRKDRRATKYFDKQWWLERTLLLAPPPVEIPPEPTLD